MQVRQRLISFAALPILLVQSVAVWPLEEMVHSKELEKSVANLISGLFSSIPISTPAGARMTQPTRSFKTSDEIDSASECA